MMLRTLLCPACESCLLRSPILQPFIAAPKLPAHTRCHGCRALVCI